MPLIKLLRLIIKHKGPIMYFDLLSLVDASVSALNVAKITKDYVAIEANVAYDFDEYIARLDAHHLDYNVVDRDKDFGIIAIIINK